VEFYSAGVDGLNSARKDRGIDGYAIQVRDQSHQRAWKTIRYIPIGDADPETYTEDIQNNHADNENNGLLNVLRDYRHYYRVRTYVDYGGKILSPPPPDPGLGGAENQYIKWGARPITATEFAGLTSLAIGTAIAGTECSPALYELFGKTVNKSINGTVFFLSAGGSVAIKANSPLSGGSITEYSGSNLTFSSPGAPFDYGGSVTISGLTSDGGSYKVTFGSTTVTVGRNFIGKPFAFGGKVTQNCDNIYDWDPAGGWQ
jgi:hypothetical protein